MRRSIAVDAAGAYNHFMPVDVDTATNPIEVQSPPETTPDDSVMPADRTPMTIRTIELMAQRGEPFAALTCYDATTARWLERAGIPLLLVGDTAAEMILGLPGTIHAPLEFLLTITAAVKRGAPNTMVMGDMPFMSYQAGPDQALINAGRFLTEATADIVKLEVDRTFAPLIERMERAGIPTVAHIGSRPQRMKIQGGYRSAGRTADSARQMIADAIAMQQAGATMLLLEACPNEVSQLIVEKVDVPVIGCGAGPACHGQIVVLQDLLGLTDWQPAFAKPMAALGPRLEQIGAEWVRRVREADLGEHPYAMAPGELGKL